MRVRLSGVEGQGGVSMLLADAAGEPVGAVQALHMRPAVASQIRGASSAARCALPCGMGIVAGFGRRLLLD